MQTQASKYRIAINAVILGLAVIAGSIIAGRVAIADLEVMHGWLNAAIGSVIQAEFGAVASMLVIGIGLESRFQRNDALRDAGIVPNKWGVPLLLLLIGIVGLSLSMGWLPSI